MERDNVTKIKTKNEKLSRFIEFSLGSEEYAIPLLMVREVISVPETTPIPKSPAHFLGIMNLRGQIISVIDLRKKLKIEIREKLDETVIIVNVGGVYIGVVVDSINRVIGFSADEVSDVPEISNQINTQFILGVYRKENSLTVLLDIAKVLDLSDMEAIGGNKKSA